MPKSLKYINVVFASLPCAQLLPNKNAQNFPPMSRFLNNTFITIYCTKLFYFIPMTTGHLHTNFHGTDQNGIVASSHKTFSLIHRERSSISMGNMHSWGGRMDIEQFGDFPKITCYPTQAKWKNSTFLDHHFKSKLKFYYTNRLYLNKLLFFFRYDTGWFLLIATLSWFNGLPLCQESNRIFFK